MTLTRRDDRIQSAYWRYLAHNHFAATDESEDAFGAGWLAGGAQVLRDSAEIAALVPALRALVSWFEVDE